MNCAIGNNTGCGLGRCRGMFTGMNCVDHTPFFSNNTFLRDTADGTAGPSTMGRGVFSFRLNCKFHSPCFATGLGMCRAR